MVHDANTATTRTYRDHREAGEEACEACLAAEAAYKRSYRQTQKAQAAGDFEEALLAEPEVEIDEWDELADALESMRLLRARARVVRSDREAAAIAKTRMELAARISGLKAAAGAGTKVDPLDEIRKRREAREAARATG